MRAEMKENTGIIKESRQKQTGAFPVGLQGVGTRVQQHEASAAGPFVAFHRVHHQRWDAPTRQDEHNGCATDACVPSGAIAPPGYPTGIRSR